MEIEYSAYWKTDEGNNILTHGVLTDADLEDAARRKEDRDSIGHTPVRFVSASWDKVNL